MQPGPNRDHKEHSVRANLQENAEPRNDKDQIKFSQRSGATLFVRHHPEGPGKTHITTAGSDVCYCPAACCCQGCNQGRTQITGTDCRHHDRIVWREVTVSMLNNWTANSHSHKLPADLIDAFCEATGDYGPLLVLTDTAGIFTVEPPDVIRARLQQLEEKKKALDKEKHRYAALLHELERKP